MKTEWKDKSVFWKHFWWKLVIWILCSSIILLFIFSYRLDKVLTLSVMNEWVSLIVGMAALILGIISLILSFYNLDQANETQKETIKIMDDVKFEIIGQLDDIITNIKVIDTKIDNKPSYFGEVKNITMSENEHQISWSKNK